MSDILQEFFGDGPPQPTRGEGSYFEAFGLSENPFPPNRRIIAEVLYNQHEAYEHFKGLTRTLLAEGGAPERRAMGILAGTGGGKTHFLRHCQYKFHELCRALRRPFATVEHTVGSLKIIELVRDVYRQCDVACREHAGMDFLTALVQALDTGGAPAEQALNSLALDEVRSALSRLVEAAREAQDYEILRESLWRWLRGETLTPTERKRLGGVARIGTATLAVRVLGQVLGLARRLQVLEGVLLCLDEMEALFSMGALFGQVQAFLHELRYLYDDAVRGGEGYSLLIISAATDTGLERLRHDNYPVYQRLGFEGARMELQSIQGVADAQSFAHHYIDYFHSKWKQEHPGRKPNQEPHSLLSTAAIEAAFKETFGGSGAPQGPLLDALHRRVEEARKQQNAKERT